MINATVAISTDVISSTSFNGIVTFPMDVTNFAVDDVQLTAVDGNGITNVVLTVSEQLPSSYSLDFQLPADAEGEFTVEITGTVLPDGETTEQPIVPNPQTSLVIYDTSVAVVATWGTPDYTVGEAQIGIPIVFASDVVVADTAVFKFSPVAPLTLSDLVGLEASINGDGTDWVLTVTMPVDIEGSVMVSVVGEVFKESTMVYDTVTIAPLVLPVNTIVPGLEKSVESPAPYRRGERYDKIFQLNTAVQFYNPRTFYGDNNAQVLDHFIWIGLNDLGTPNLYVFSGTGFPNLPLPDTANLGPDWAIWTAGIAASSVYMLRYDPISNTAISGPDVFVKENTYYNPGV